MTSDTSGDDTGVTTVLDTALPLNVRPSGNVYVYAAEDWFVKLLVGGGEVITIENESVLLEFGARIPSGMPDAGSAPARDSPLKMTLFGTSTAPAGMGSVNVAEAPMLPVLVITVEYTTVSPTTALGVLAVLASATCGKNAGVVMIGEKEVADSEPDVKLTNA